MDWRKCFPVPVLSLVLVFAAKTNSLNEPTVYYFAGNNFITYDFTEDGEGSKSIPVNISFRARYENNEGVIFYSYSPPGNILSLELSENFLYTNIYYANPESNSGFVTHHSGSGLGINEEIEWNNVSLSLQRTGMMFEVNLASTYTHEPATIPINSKVYIGGYDRSGPDKGIKSKRWFSGCIEDFTLNGVNIFQAVRNSDPGVQFYRSNLLDRCPLITSYMTFHGFDSYLRIPSNLAPGRVMIEISFEFRTFDENATLLLVNVGPGSNITIDLKENNTIVASSRSGVFGFSNDYNIGFDVGTGEYNTIIVQLTSTELTLNIGNFKKVDRLMKLPRGSKIQAYYIGGSTGSVGYQGCLRNIFLNNQQFDVAKMSTDDVVNVTLGKCELIDRCYRSSNIPRCSHGGKCVRHRQDFHCDCSGTKYGGPTCHTPLYLPSCDMVEYPQNSNRVITTLDVDGTGPLAPTEVLCSKDNGEITTTIRSRLTNPTNVDGFQEPGSYGQNASYAISIPEAVGVIKHAVTCRQFLEYTCTRSKLMSSPDSSTAPYGWWLDRNDEPQYYWAGGVEGSRTCFCYTDAGCLGGSSCNCDADVDFKTEDSGYLTNKTRLPVTGVRFGDTGTDSDSKSASYKVGDVECSGNVGLDGQVSIKKLGSSIKVNRFWSSVPIDVTFQFKTTIQRAQLLHAPEQRKGHFLSIRLEDAKTVSVYLGLDPGLSRYQRKTLSTSLNDNQWHTVYFELNHKNAILKVDDESLVIWEADNWWFHRQLASGRPIMLGANENGTLGFVGCFRGLVIRGLAVDLLDLVTRKPQDGVHPGCSGQCDTAGLCKNGGRCREYYATYMCDCSTSAFSGCYCGAAVGVSFKLGSWMLSVIKDRLTHTTLNTLQLYFKTTKLHSVLAHVTGTDPSGSADTSILTAEINQRGGVDVSFGGGSVIVSSQDGLADGNAHQIKIRIMRSRDGTPTTLEMNVDGQLETRNTGSTKYTPQRLFLGSKSSTSSSGTFNGCIFGVMYNNLPVLKEATMVPTPDYVFTSAEVNLDAHDCGEKEYLSPKPTQDTSTPKDESPTENANYRRPVTISGFGSESLDGRRTGVISSLFVSHLVNLVCRADGMPEAMYVIKQNGGDLVCPHLQASDNTVLLPPDDRIEGQYQCFPNNAWSKSMSDIATVQTPKLMKVSSVIEESVFMTEGQYVRLRCNVSVESAPEAETSWGQVDLKDNTDERIYQGIDGDLHFLWVLPTDSKVYTCWKVNTFLDKRVEVKRIQLQVNGVGDPKEYTSKPAELVYSSSSPTYVDVGTAAILECLVVVHPVPTITWSRQLNNISSTAIIAKHGRRLTVPNFSRDHQGQYSCMVGDTEFATVQLNISMKPYWTSMPRRVAVYQGQKATLHCQTQRLPEDVTVTTEWYRNGQPFDHTANERYEMSDTGDVLIINDASKMTDIQSFQCNVSTPYGYVFGEGFVNVLLPTTIVKTPKKVAKNFNLRGRPAKFKVSVSADPGANVTFTWYHNDTLINSSKVFVITNQSTQSQLEIFLGWVDWEIEAPSYAGIYRCTIDDEVREQSVSAELKIYMGKTGTDAGSTSLAGLSTDKSYGKLFIILILLRTGILIGDILKSCLVV